MDSAREAALHKRGEGIKTIATVTVLKKERPNSLGSDIIILMKYQKCRIFFVMFYDCYQQNPNKCIVLEDVHYFIRCTCIAALECWQVHLLAFLLLEDNVR